MSPYHLSNYEERGSHRFVRKILQIREICLARLIAQRVWPIELGADPGVAGISGPACETVCLRMGRPDGLCWDGDLRCNSTERVEPRRSRKATGCVSDRDQIRRLEAAEIGIGRD